MTSDTTVVALRQPEAVDDPLTTVLRSGARRLLAQAVGRKPRPSWPRCGAFGCRTGASGWSVMATGRSAWCRPASGRCRCGG